MSRDDMSGSLIHFTKGATAKDDEGAFSHLLSIANEGVLRGGDGSGFIKGGYVCVCFTEAPLASVRHGLVNSSDFGRYSPFGVMFNKEWVFAQGGRPVIYEPEAEYEPLPESHRWRHVRYEPMAADHPTDFTWEREWRIRRPELKFEPTDAIIVVPSRHWADQLSREHQDDLIRQYSTIMDDYAAEYYGLSVFPWHITILNE